MRAPDEFTDVTSAGYREQAKRVAERGGAKQYATSVEEEEGKKRADEIRNLVLMTLVALTTFGEATGANRVGRYINERDAFFARNPTEVTLAPTYPTYRTVSEGRAQQFERTARQQAEALQRKQWIPQEGIPRRGMGDPALYRSSGGMSVPEDVLKAIEAVSRQAFNGIITTEELRVALWEIERRATPLGMSTRISGPYRGGTPPGGIHN
jgi:hypothetical protein